MGQHLDPAGVFMKILMSDKFKTVYKQSNLLSVRGHVSYKGNARVAGSVMFCPYPSSSPFEDWVHQQEQCLCLLLGWGWKRMLFSLAWPFHTAAVTL